MTSILPNMRNMTFVDHELRKIPKLEMEKSMVSICDIEYGHLCLVPMEWERGLDKVGLLSLMHMLHFGRSVEVNACVKKLLVSFHGGYLWLNQNIYVDVELISTITRLPLAGVDPTPFFDGKE